MTSVKLALGIFGVAGLVSSWMLLRNRLLYGEWLGNGMERRAFPWMIQEKSLLSPYFRGMFPKLLYTSFVGRFGWMDVLLPTFAYGFYLLLMGAAGVGVCWYLARRPAGEEPFSPLRVRVYGALGCIACCLAGIILFNLTHSQPQGRYLFSVLSLIGALVALGGLTLAARLKLFRRLSRSGAYALAAVCAALLIGIDLLSLWRIYRS